MSIGAFPGPIGLGIDTLRRNWCWFVALGVIQLILGAIGVGASVWMTVFSVILFGLLLIVGGAASVCHAFMQRQWGGFFIDLATGVLYLLVGIITIEQPAEAAVTLTLLIALFLMMGGLFRIIAAIAGQFHQWGWVLLNGVVTLALGIMIWRRWPISGMWVIGMFVGIEMIVYGWSLIMLGLAAKRLPKLPA